MRRLLSNCSRETCAKVQGVKAAASHAAAAAWRAGGSVPRLVGLDSAAQRLQHHQRQREAEDGRRVAHARTALAARTRPRAAARPPQQLQPQLHQQPPPPQPKQQLQPLQASQSAGQMSATRVLAGLPAGRRSRVNSGHDTTRESSAAAYLGPRKSEVACHEVFAGLCKQIAAGGQLVKRESAAKVEVRYKLSARARSQERR